MGLVQLNAQCEPMEEDIFYKDFFFFFWWGECSMNILLNASFQRLLGTGPALDSLKTDRNIFISSFH